MTRILVGECKLEVSTFNPAISTYGDFAISVGDDVLAFHDGIDSEVGGARRVFRQHGVEEIGAYSARAITSGGTLAAGDWDRIAGEFLVAIRQAPPVDGVFFSM